MLKQQNTIILSKSFNNIPKLLYLIKPIIHNLKNIKKRTISSCMDLVGDHGAQQRDEWKGFVGEEEKWRRGRRRREKEGEET